MESIENNSIFWQTNMDINDPLLDLDKSPFTVSANLSLSKLHFIFLMLGLQQAFVVHHSHFLGLISIKDFQKW